MSERLLVSPSPLLDGLAKEMQFRLDHYPTMAMTYEKVESCFNRLQQLFAGGYRSIKFETAKLHSCISLFCKCILIYIQDATDVKREDLLDYIRRWLVPLDNIGDLDCIKDKFTYFVPILKDSMLKKAPPWFTKEFLFHLTRIFEKANQLAVFDKTQLKFFLITLAKWLKLIITCGDYEFQAIVVKCIINICKKDQLAYVFKQKLDDTGEILPKLLAVYDQKDYVNDLQVFLSTINDIFKNVYSVPCCKVTLQETVIPPLKGANGDVIWMHINYVFRTFSFSCHRDSLRNLPGSDAYSNVDEFVTINFDDIDEVYFLINNDSTVNNSVGGIFTMKLSGQCSCRFNSSKGMVSSIKKIVVMVPVGTHLEFLKEEFTTLFGEKFKKSVQIPNKRRSLSRKKDSTLNSSQHSLSFKAENRRRMKNGTDSATSSQKSFSIRNLKLNNSLTLENEESVLEGSKDCFLISTGMRSNKPVVTENKERKLIDNKENIADNFSINTKVNETKEDKSIITSKGTNDMKSNLSLKVNSKNKVNVENSQNCFSISPDTTTHLDKESDSIIAPHFTKKLLTAKKEKMRHDTTKKDSLFLKNSDVDNLTTFQNAENMMTEDSEIFSNNTFPNEEESMETPSAYKFDKDCNISVSEENRDSLLDFINSELSNISDLNIHGKENISPCKPKDMNQNRNFGIFDSSLISVNSSVPKSISKAKSDRLDLDVPFASSSIKEISKKKDKREYVPKIIIKRKKDVKCFGISNNSLEHLPKNLPNIKNKVQTRSSLKVPDSCTLQNADEIVGDKVNKNKSLKARVGVRKQKAPTKINYSYYIEKAKLSNENVARDLEIPTNGQTAEESEYYSFIPDNNTPKEDNEESNQMNNYSEPFASHSGKNYTLKQLINMNTEEIGSVEIFKVEGQKNDNVLTLDSQTVNLAGSEYYSCDPDITSTENNEIYNGIRNSDTSEWHFNADSNASIATLNIGTDKHKKISRTYSLNKLAKINDSYDIENNTEQLIEYDESEDWKLTVQQVNPVEESEYFSSAFYQGSDQQNSETPDLDVILATCSNIVSPSVDSKNVNTKISTTLEELVNHSDTLKNTKEQFLNKEVIQRNDNLILKGNQKGKSIMEPCSNTLKNANNENTNEEANITNVRLSTETVKCYQIDDDNISVISISSDEDEDIYSDGKFDGIEEVIQDVQTIPSEIFENYQIVNNSFTCEQIDNRLDDNVTKTDEDIMNMQISDVIQEGSEKQNEIDDHLNIICTLSIEENVLGTELDNYVIATYSESVNNIMVTEFEEIEDDSTAEEKIENDINETNEDVEVKIECDDIVQNDADIEISDTPISVSKEKNEFDKDHFDFQLAQLTDVPILLKEVVVETELQKKSSQSLENDVVDLGKANSDESPMYLLNKHQQNLDKSNTSMEGVENSFTLMKSKSVGLVSNKVSCEQDKLTKAPVALNKIKVLSNVRIAPPFHRRINQSQNDDHLVKEKYTAVVNELPKANAKVNCAMQKVEELEQTPNLQTNQVNKKKSVKGKKKKLTQKHKTLKSQDDPGICKERSNEINSFQEFIKSSDEKTEKTNNKTENNLKKLENTRYWPTKKFLLNKFNISQQESTKLALNTNTSIESDFERLGTRNEETNSHELELNIKILSPQKSLFDGIATNEKKNAKEVTHKLQKPKEATYFEEFLSCLSNKSPLNNSTEEENKLKLSQNGDRNDLEKLKVPKKQIDDYEEFSLTLQSKKRLLDEAVPSNTQKRRKLTGDDQVSHKIHQVKEDNCEKTTSYVESTQKMQKFEISDWERIERVKEDNCVILTPKKKQFKKFNERKASTPRVELTQKKQNSEVSDSEIMERAKENSFEMLTIEKIQFNKFNEQKTSTPYVESTQQMQKFEVNNWETIERVEEDYCEILTPKKTPFKKFNERRTSPRLVELTQKKQKSEISDSKMIEITEEDSSEMLTSEKLPFGKFNERKTSTPRVESTQKIQKSKRNDFEMMERAKEGGFEMLTPKKRQFKKYNESKTSTPYVESTQKMQKFEVKRKTSTPQVELTQKIQKSKGSDCEMMERTKEDSFEIMLTPKKRQFKKCNKLKTSTLRVESTQKMQKSEVSDCEMIENAEEDSSEMLTPEEIPFDKFNERKTSTPRIESTQKIQKANGSDFEMIERAKEDSFDLLALEKMQFEKFSESKTSTPYVESTQEMQKFEVNDWERIERVKEDNSEILTPKKIPFKKYNKRKPSTPRVESTQTIQKPKESECEMMERAKEEIFEMLALEKIKFLKFNESKTSTPHVESTQKMQTSKVSDWEKIERINEKFKEFKKVTPHVESTQKIQKSKVSDWKMIERVKEDNFKMLTPKKLKFEKFKEFKKVTPPVESTQEIQKSKVSDWKIIETDKIELDQLKEFVPICTTSENSVAASKAEQKKLIEVQLTPKIRKSENIAGDVNFIQQYQSIINLPQLDEGEPVKKKKLIKVQSVGRKQKSKENCYEKLPVINEEEFGLPRMNSIASGSEWNKNIDFDWNDFKIGKENNDRLYNILNHPRRVYKICDKTGEALKFGKPIGYKGKEVKNDEEFNKVADSIYGFDAMQFALKSYLKMCDSTQKKRKPQKKTITKMKLYTPKKAKSKSKNKKYTKLS